MKCFYKTSICSHVRSRPKFKMFIFFFFPFCLVHKYICSCMYNFKKKPQQFYNADVSQVDRYPHVEKANQFHGINAQHNDNVSVKLQTYYCEQLLRGLISSKPFSLKEIRLINRRYNDFKVCCNSTAEYKTEN